MKQDAMSSGKVDVFKWWLLLASDVSAHLAFGESFGMLKTGQVRLWYCTNLTRPRLMTKQKTKLIEVLKKLTKGAGISVELPVLRLLRYVPIAAIQEIFNTNEV